MKKGWIILFILLSVTTAYAGTRSQLRHGGKLYQHKKYGLALNAYQNILKKDPTNQTALFNAGNAFYRLHEYTQAEESYKQATQQEGEYTQHAFYNLGNAYYRAGDMEQAIAAYKTAIVQNPQDKEAIHNLQLILQQKQNQNDNKQNNQNQNSSSDNQSQQDDPNKGQSPQQPPQQTPQSGQLSQQEADRVMAMAKEHEYNAGAAANHSEGEETVEKDW